MRAPVGIAYTSDGLLGDVTYPTGEVSTHVYNEHGRFVSGTNADGQTWTHERLAGADGNVGGAISSAEGTTRSRVAYTDSRGTSSTVTNTYGMQWRSWRSQDGMTARSVAPDGTRTESSSTYDDVIGLPIPASSKTTLPSGLARDVSMARSYEGLTSAGAFTAVIDAVTVNGRTATVRDDVSAGILTATSPSGRSVRSVYDTATLLPVRTEAAGLAPVTYAHDTRGRVTAVSAGTRTTSYSYDTSGNVESVTAPDGKVTSFTYDPVGRVTSQVRPDGTTVGFSYDAGGKMTSLVTPSGAVHGFTSTPRGARTGYTAPISGAYAYAYDGAGRLKTVTSPSGAVVTNTYAGEFLSSTSFAGGTIGYSHLPCGKLDSTTRGAETSGLTYDGPLVTREVRSGSVPATLTFAYDADFRPTQFRYAEATQTYAYDPDGLIVSAAPFTVSRDASSGLAYSVTAPGFALQRTYSAYGEIDAAVSAASGYTLTRDTAGRIVSKTETTPAGAHTWVYAYDGLGRLSTATRDGVLAESYAYDAQGNRTAMRAPVRGIEDTVTAVFDAEDRAVRIVDAAFAFTDDGYLASRTTSAGATTYSYTGLGELASVTLADGRRVSYAYDAAGRRVSRSIDGAVVERYLWADTTRLLATYDAAGTLTRRFLYADARTPYAMDTPAGRFFLHYDQVGSLVAVTDSAGAVVETIERDSFGNVLSDSNAGFSVPLGFAGGLEDADTGLTLFGARDYDPATGRWCAKDPIGFAGGDANLYGYCLGDPVGLVDPAGTDTYAATGPGHNFNVNPVGVDASFNQYLVWDDRGCFGIQRTFNFGIRTNHSAGWSAQYTHTNRETIEELRGWGKESGWSGGNPGKVTVGGGRYNEWVWDEECHEWVRAGETIAVGPSVSGSPVPVDWHFNFQYTWIQPQGDPLGNPNRCR